jgi:hypothetical protein
MASPPNNPQAPGLADDVHPADKPTLGASVTHRSPLGHLGKALRIREIVNKIQAGGRFVLGAGDRRGGTAPNDEVRSDQDRRSMKTLLARRAADPPGYTPGCPIASYGADNPRLRQRLAPAG